MDVGVGRTRPSCHRRPRVVAVAPVFDMTHGRAILRTDSGYNGARLGEIPQRRDRDPDHLLARGGARDLAQRLDRRVAQEVGKRVRRKGQRPEHEDELVEAVHRMRSERALPAGAPEASKPAWSTQANQSGDSMVATGGIAPSAMAWAATARSRRP